MDFKRKEDGLKIRFSKAKKRVLFDTYGKKVVKEAARRINAGATELDDYTPGWVTKIALDTLDLGDADACVCGQLFVNKAARSWEANRWPDDLPDKFRYEEAYAFDSFYLDGHDEDEEYLATYSLLNELWSALIEARLSTGKDILFSDDWGKAAKVSS